MSAYKEKELAEKRMAELEIEITRLEAKLWIHNVELKEAKERLEEAIQCIKWEAQNDR